MIKIKDKENSDLFFYKLSEVNIAYEYQLDETIKIPEVVAEAPKKCASI